ncbi:unnamed protein product [Enterobius vermicularis]|uniref:CCDC50_N domain-containing protein n=1 Tax=Enterobius vermicularis TaxID=51028 RepID=A0A0N4VJY2_ENTVE|nr:unnamed protein product [Enterobius vermicularis]
MKEVRYNSFEEVQHILKMEKKLRSACASENEEIKKAKEEADELHQGMKEDLQRAKEKNKRLESDLRDAKHRKEQIEEALKDAEREIERQKDIINRQKQQIEQLKDKYSDLDDEEPEDCSQKPTNVSYQERHSQEKRNSEEDRAGNRLQEPQRARWASQPGRDGYELDEDGGETNLHFQNRRNNSPLADRSSLQRQRDKRKSSSQKWTPRRECENSPSPRRSVSPSADLQSDEAQESDRQRKYNDITQFEE